MAKLARSRMTTDTIMVTAVGRVDFDVTPRRPPTSEWRFGSSALDLLRRPRHHAVSALGVSVCHLSDTSSSEVPKPYLLETDLADRRPPQRHDTERRPGGPRHTPESAPTRGAKGPITRRFQRGGDTIAITQRGNTQNDRRAGMGRLRSGRELEIGQQHARKT